MSDTQQFTSMNKGLQCDYTLMEALGFVLLWILITVVTFGLGSFVAIYYFYKTMINKTYVVDASGMKTGRLECDLNLAEMFGHMFIWLLITLVTFGIGIIFYAFRTFRMCINKTTIVPV